MEATVFKFATARGIGGHPDLYRRTCGILASTGNLIGSEIVITFASRFSFGSLHLYWIRFSRLTSCSSSSFFIASLFSYVLSIMG